MARKAGMSPKALARIKEDLQSTKPVEDTSTDRHKVHAGRYVNDEDYDEDKHDFGPWVMTPNSTRVGGFRYDFANGAVHVQWTGKGTTRSYMYEGVPYETYRSMIRTASKGRFVNSSLNNFDYREAAPDEVNAASNEQRSVPASRKKG